MQKYFNIAGPCNENDHYIVPIIERNKAILPLIEQKHYFVIHAARQSGKTTLIKALVNHLNASKRYHALYCSLESAHVFTDPNQGLPIILSILKSAVKYSKLPHRTTFAENIDTKDIGVIIKDSLVNYCQKLDKPLVVFFDEIDGLKNGTLISFLRQLREGYVNRPEIAFPHSISLIGMRNIRDYKAKIRADKNTLGSPSPFNIITKALTLNNFTFSEIENLYQQHTQATEQVFEQAAVQKIYEDTDGQPWLVNAIAREVIVEIFENDLGKKINTSVVDQAIDNIIKRRDTHIDSLLERLNEKRVQKVLEPIITGEKYAIDITDDDTQYCLDLGLIKNHQHTLMPANKIYGEMIIRKLTYTMQYHLYSEIKNRWIQANGSLDMSGLLKSFQQFWRENSGIWKEKYEYKEAAPHLILMAYLQTVVNSGGSVHREYASNKDRMDLYVQFGKFVYPIEIKIRYDTKTVAKGLIQLSDYMDVLGEKTGWLIVFSKLKSKSWDEKITWTPKKVNGKTIFVVGC